MPNSDEADAEVPNLDADHGNGSAPVIAEEVDDNSQVDPLPRAVAVQSVPSRINDENVSLGPLGTLGPFTPLSGDAELGTQQE